MTKIGKFEKVSFNEFKREHLINLKPFYVGVGLQYPTEENIKKIWEEIKLPVRATKGSAGYDFFMPQNIALDHNEDILIPTGIKVTMDEGWVLACFPRSGLGSKYKMQLCNTVGIIDSDYINADNEGHIMFKIVNKGYNMLTIEKGRAFVQGVFLPFGITKDDEVNDDRVGGFGSSEKG